jgi:hypothetical protein
VFRKHTFQSPLARSDFLQRLGTLVTNRVGFFGARQGRIYGKVGEDGFELWTPGSTRAHVIRVVGTLDLDARPIRGTLRVTPEPAAVVPLVLVVLLAIASQFLADTWVRLGLPVVALLAIANFLWQTRVEWQQMLYRLKAELLVSVASR